MIWLKVLLSIYFFIIGSIFSSFFGVVISRVPKGESIIKPSSHCPKCGHKLKWYENIPIFSYIFLKGRCSSCKDKIGIKSLLFEIIGGLTLMLTYLVFDISYDLLFVSLIALVLLLISGYDYETQEILDITLWLLFLLVGGYLVYQYFALDTNLSMNILSSLVSVTFFGLIKILILVVKKQDGLGNGDIYLMGIASLLFSSLYQLLIAVLIASIVGSVVELIKLKVSKKEDSLVAFGPYLALGILFSVLYGNVVITWIGGLI